MTEEKLPPREATYKAMEQIYGAIIAITLVLCAVFVPMAFFGGSVGAIYRQFAVTLILTILFSVLMALTLTPALCAALLKNDPGHEMVPTKGFFGWFNRFFANTSQRYKTGVSGVLKHTGRYLLLYAALLGVLGWLFLHLPSSFLPEEDQGYFINVIQLPPGATRERSQEVLLECGAVLSQTTRSAACHRRARVSLSSVADRMPPLSSCVSRIGMSGPSRKFGSRHGEARQHGAVPHQAGDSSLPSTYRRFPELAALGGFDFRLAGSFRPGTGQVARSAQHGAGAGEQEARW